MKNIKLILILILVIGCKENIKSIKPKSRKITESVYASGYLETENQYQVYSSVNGIISKIYLNEGTKIKNGTPLFQISNRLTKSQTEIAILSSENASLKNNKNKLESLKLNLKVAKYKWRNDSLIFIRKKYLFNKNVITSIEFENAELNYENSMTNYKSSLLQYEDLCKELKFNDRVAKKNSEQITNTNQDFTIKSEIDGEIFSILKKRGEFISPQVPIAVIGSTKSFIIKLQIDEYDIVRIKIGQKAKISLDSYKGKTFDATITKIYPIMNERSKTFLIDAQFNTSPPLLYPNLSAEANIIISEVENSLTIPRKYLTKKNTVFLSNGEERKIELGLKNYEYIQILKGLTFNDEIILPNEN